jgi:hypothetical protein
VAPAGAGKTHSLKALRAAAHRARKQVLACAPTGKAVDEALAEGAGDDGLTVAKALAMIERRELEVDRSTVIVVDEASMVGTADLRKLLACATVGRAKIVLVGDAFQLSPVKARGGMFEQLCSELPWSQRLSAVWRMRDPDERDASLALRSARGNRLRTAVGWYRSRGRLHTGDPIAMASDALAAYEDSRGKGRNALLICDTWELADALNRRLHDAHMPAAAQVVVAVRGQEVGCASGRCAIPGRLRGRTRRRPSSCQIRTADLGVGPTRQVATLGFDHRPCRSDAELRSDHPRTRHPHGGSVGPPRPAQRRVRPF